MFGFPTIEHKVFKRNFLRKVIFQVHINKRLDLFKQEEFIKEIFTEKFPRFVKSQGEGIQITFNQNSPQFESLAESFILKTKEGTITLEINEKLLQLSFDSSAYTSSNDIKELLPLIVAFFNDKSDCISKVSLKKINIIEFDKNNNPNGILYFLLNRGFVGNMDSFPNTHLISHNLQSVNYKNENFYLNLKYGMNIPPIEKLNIGQAIIDIEIVKHTSTSLKNLEEVFYDINSEIFNVFNALINDNAKSILNGS